MMILLFLSTEQEQIRVHLSSHARLTLACFHTQCLQLRCALWK